eukprot:3265130-Pyramimonas_sp.AAC.1
MRARAVAACGRAGVVPPRRAGHLAVRAELGPQASRQASDANDASDYVLHQRATAPRVRRVSVPVSCGTDKRRPGYVSGHARTKSGRRLRT